MYIVDFIRNRFKSAQPAPVAHTPEKTELAALRAEVAALREDFAAEIRRIGAWGENQIEARLTNLESPTDYDSRIAVLELEHKIASAPTSSRNGSKMDMTHHEFGNKVTL